MRKDTSKTQMLMRVLFILLSFWTGLSRLAHSLELPPKTENIIAVGQEVSDKKIEQRLHEILTAAGTFNKVTIAVRSGVVILGGTVDTDEQRDWIQKLAERTEAVVLVRNQLSLNEQNFFDLSPARNEFQRLKDTTIQKSPLIFLAFIVLLLTVVFCYLSFIFFRKTLSRFIGTTLLLVTVSKLLTVPIFLLGLYLILRISGLTGLAFTVLGGTGLLGLIVGFGFKGFFENYITSLFISVKKPFKKDDWVTIGKFDGIVQRVTTRTTTLMDFDGNHILIPNTEIFKNVIINKTANPKMRSSFVVGIDYTSSIDQAQKIIHKLLNETPAVLKDSEPWVLVDFLDASSVNLKVYFWVNVREVSVFKVSSYLRSEVKSRLLNAKIKLPDSNREIVFTNSLPTAQNFKAAEASTSDGPQSAPSLNEFKTEAIEISQQANEADHPDKGENLLEES